MKRTVRYVLVVIGCFLAASLFLISPFAIPFVSGGVIGYIQDTIFKHLLFVSYYQ